MAFAPVVPMGGVSGWILMKRIEGQQRETFDKSPEIKRATEYFQANIHKATSASELMKDRRLLEVALGAFGLEDEIDKKAFIQKVLESDPLDQRSFANKLIDSRYGDMANAFGYGSILGAQVGQSDFAAKITADYASHMFEVAVGESDADLRLALNARSQLADLAELAIDTGKDGSAWFKALGDRPLREVLQTAFGLPSAFSQIDLDKQRDVLREKTRELFGEESIAVFQDPEKVDLLVRRFLARKTAEQGITSATPGAGALTILQSGAASFANLIQSRFS